MYAVFFFFPSSLALILSPFSPYPLLLLFNTAKHSFPTLCSSQSLPITHPLSLRSTIPDFPFRKKNQASQGYKLNTSQQDPIRLGTKPSFQGWERQPSRRKIISRPDKRVKDTPIPTASNLTKQQANNYNIYSGPSLALYMLSDCFLVSVSPYQPSLIDTVSHVLLVFSTLLAPKILPHPSF